jgi:hypothetical protein
VFQKLKPYLIALLAALLAALGVKVLPDITPKPDAPPKTEPKPDDRPKPPEPKPTDNPIEAIGRIQIGNGGCTATVIGPRRPDGRWNLLTAAHCATRVGESGVMRLRDGRTLGFVVAALDRKSDACWLLTTDTPAELPWLHLADTTPEPGTKIFHAGFGRHVPGNREDGQVKAGANADGQSQFWLSVSPGDSGGGICVDESGKVVSPVCCTTRLDGPGDVWGASPEASRRLLAQITFQVFDDWKPVDMPIRPAAAVPQRMPEAK